MSEADTLTPGQQKRVDTLLELAEEEFGKEGLSDFERRVIRCAAMGTVADFSDLNPNYPGKLDEAIEAESEALREDKPLPSRPTPPAEVSAALLRWLLSSCEAKPHIHAHGVRTRYVRIKQTLNLSQAVLAGPVWIVSSVLEGGIDLSGGTCLSINMQYTRV